MELFLCLSYIKPQDYVNQRITIQNTWKQKNFNYKNVIEKLLSYRKAKYVLIPEKGDPFIKLLRLNGKMFPKLPIKVIGTSGSKDDKIQVFKYVSKNPGRYRLCVGYALTSPYGVYYWTKHYWVFDTQHNQLLEFNNKPYQYYYGIILSKQSASKLVQATRI